MSETSNYPKDAIDRLLDGEPNYDDAKEVLRLTIADASSVACVASIGPRTMMLVARALARGLRAQHEIASVKADASRKIFDLTEPASFARAEQAEADLDERTRERDEARRQLCDDGSARFFGTIPDRVRAKAEQRGWGYLYPKDGE